MQVLRSERRAWRAAPHAALVRLMLVMVAVARAGGERGEQRAGGGMADGHALGRVARTYASVLLWIGLSSGLIFFNKYLLDTLQFNFPLCLTMVRAAPRALLLRGRGGPFRLCRAPRAAPAAPPSAAACARPAAGPRAGARAGAVESPLESDEPLRPRSTWPSEAA